jgi:hypothetical protein
MRKYLVTQNILSIIFGRGEMWEKLSVSRMPFTMTANGQGFLLC